MMDDYRPPWIISFLIASLKSSLILIWGGGFLWYGMSLGEFQNDGSNIVDHYSFHIMGAIFIILGLCGFAYNLLKLRAPTKASDKLTEAGEVTFDPDAAIANYLASKKAGGTDLNIDAESIVTRPVFGRKSSNSL